MKVIWALFIFSLSFPVIAIEKNELDELAIEFAGCSGFYESNSKFFESEKKPAAAEKFMGLARGARLAAAYIFSLDNNRTGNDVAILFRTHNLKYF